MSFAASQVAAWSAPPVDDVGYIPSADLLKLSDADLRVLAVQFRKARYRGQRNYMNLWRDLMGLDSLRGLDVMDFGCGTGIESAELARNNQVVLADISHANLDLAARMLALHRREPAGTVLVAMEWPYIDWPDGSLDVFYASGVLHHIPWARAIMERAHAMLRPGGQCRLMLYSGQGWRIACGTEPPGDVTADPLFGRFVRFFDGVGDYADWYDRSRLEERFGDLFTVERCEHMTPDSRYLGAVLRRRP